MTKPGASERHAASDQRREPQLQPELDISDN